MFKVGTYCNKGIHTVASLYLNWQLLPSLIDLRIPCNMQYNTKDSSVRLAYEAQPRPRPIAAFSGETIVKVACGTNHTGSSQLHFNKFVLCPLFRFVECIYLLFFLDFSCSG